MQNIIEQLAEYENKQVDEFNQVVAALEESENKASELSALSAVMSDTIEQQSEKLNELDYVVKTQHEAILKQQKNKDIYLKNEESLKRQVVAEKLQNNSLKHLTTVAKKELKTLKEQVKRNKAAMKQRDDKIARLEKKLGKDAKLAELQTIYCKGDDVLIVYPTKLTLSFNGLTGDQVVLLYTDRRGCFVTGCLNADNEIVFSSFIKKDAKISEHTGKLINKNTLQIPDHVAEFAQAWLYKVNVMQKMRIEQIDLVTHK